MEDTRAVLKKADAQLTMIGTLYEADLELQRVSPTLRAKIHGFLENERAALDQLAARLVASLGAGEAHVHYPMAADEPRFEASISKNLPGINEQRPEVAAAIARHQPFNVPGLGQLRELLVDETRQRLTPETRPAPPEPASPEPAPPAADEVEAAPPAPPPPRPPGLGAGLTGGVFINGVEHDPVTMQPLNPVAPARRETIYVDWRFEGSETSALRALESIHVAVSAAIDEVAAAAGLT